MPPTPDTGDWELDDLGLGAWDWGLGMCFGDFARKSLEILGNTGKY